MEPTRPTTRDGFDIAIICALTLEADAVEAVFDQFWEDDGPEYGKAPGDPNAYSTGSIGKHNVVLAHMPGMGKVSSAVVAANCRTSFPNIKLALVVGICGAVPIVPGSNMEIILGDVIISSGVIQYDLGRQLEERFVRKDTLLESLGRPNPEIRSLLTKLEGIRSRKNLRNKMVGYLDELQKEPELGAKYPGVECDKLYPTTYRHIADGKTCEECGCDGGLIRRDRLSQGIPQPIVHFGLIASGDTVMKSGEKRDSIAQHESVIGFEMEGAGVWDTFPCIVIKGACDYADSHKTKVWQRYAAATTAACAKALLEYWMPSMVTTKKILRARFLVPYTSNPDFIGRLDILNTLKNHLGYLQRKSTPFQTRASLYGLGGIGKTQIALQFVFWLQRTQPTVSIFWVHASNAERFYQAYLSIAQQCQIPDHTEPQAYILKLVKDWLENDENGEWLMVIDNADDLLLFSDAKNSTITSLGSDDKRNLARYLPEYRHGTILITTRNKQVGVRLTKGQQPIEVLPMDQNESEQLLRAKLKDANTASTEFLTLSTQLEHLPLALAQSAAYIQETSITVERYLQLLGNSDKNTVHLLSKDFETIGRDSEAPHAVAQTWILSFHQVEKQYPLASEILSFMSMLDRQSIPLEFISNYTYYEVEGDPPSEIEIEEALGVLKAFSFVTQEKSGSFDMHRLVQLLTRKWLTSQGTISWFGGGALMAVSDLYPYGEFETRELCAAYLSHANTVLGFGELKPSRRYTRARGDLLHCIAGYYSFEGKWNDAEKFISEAAKIREELLGADHSETISSISDLASVYNDQGRYEEAEKLQIQVMEARREKLGPNDPATLGAMSRLAFTYNDQGRYEEAENLQSQVLKIRQEVLEADHPSTLSSMVNLASVYNSLGRWEKAEKLEVQVLEIRLAKLGADHPTTLSSMASLASVYSHLGKWEKAEKLEVQVMENRLALLGADHPSTLISMTNLASTYGDLGRSKEAEKLQVQVMEISTAKLGASHPSTLQNALNLAATYCDMNRLEEAKELEEHVTKMTTEKLGADHPLTLTSMAHLASTYSRQGQWEEAEKLEVKVLELSTAKLGANHPMTLTSMASLAITYSEQGRLEEAEKLEVQTLELRTKILGADHHHTLFSMVRLASTWRKKGRNDDALALMEACAKARHRILGATHPYTISSVSTLEEWRS